MHSKRGNQNKKFTLSSDALLYMIITLMLLLIITGIAIAQSSDDYIIRNKPILRGFLY